MHSNTSKSYYVYITTNYQRKVLYIGMTNNLSRRLGEHSLQSKISGLTFTGKYKAVHLIYYEVYSDVKNAIEREKRLKGWTRAKKNQLISSANPDWEFLSVT